MSWYDRNKKPFNPYALPESRDGWTDHRDNESLPNVEGMKPVIIGYAATRDTERYQARNQQVIQFRGLETGKKPVFINSPKKTTNFPFAQGKTKREELEDEDEDDEKEMQRGGKGYSPPSYKPVPVPYYEPTKNEKSPKKNSPLSEDDYENKGNTYSPPSYTAQTIRYDINKGPPPPIKVQVNPFYARQNPIEGSSPPIKVQLKPFYAHQKPIEGPSPPIKVPFKSRDPYYVHQKPIDSKEAKLKYGPKNGKARVYDEYTETIDCIQAARKYNGVFIPN